MATHVETIEVERGVHTCQEADCKADARFKIVSITADMIGEWFSGSSGKREVVYLCRKHYIKEHGEEWL